MHDINALYTLNSIKLSILKTSSPFNVFRKFFFFFPPSLCFLMHSQSSFNTHQNGVCELVIFKSKKLTNTLRVLINNSFKESFYGKKKQLMF